ncbi:MAG: cysteine hydrolase family protein [Alphaproteobacteria bacterium]|jgi:nicotinamidase-related amidase
MAPPQIDDQTALVLIDVQKSIDEPVWAMDGPRNNEDGEANLARLLDAWRRAERPVVHVRHDSTNPESPYSPEKPSHGFKDEVIPLAGELVVGKKTNSAFIGTGLEQHLRDRRLTRLVIAGVITNNSVEATVRMAGNLGFDTIVAADACWTFAKRDWSGTLRTAQEVHDMALANMDGEYARVLTTDAVLGR